MTRIFIIGGIGPGGVPSAREVVPVSVVFAAPPPRRTEPVIVDDLGVPEAARCRNDAPRFWSGERQ